MFGWLKELYDINHERRLNQVTELDSKNEVQRSETVCQSCETLKMQLAIANQHVEKLMDRLMAPPVEIPIIQPQGELKPVTMSKNHLSWNTRRQMLEENDRATARINREKEREINSARTQIDKAVEQVEEELGIKV